MPNLADCKTIERFVDRLTRCEKYDHLLSDSDVRFVERLRESFDTREAAIDLGCNPWNPAADDWNRLFMLAERFPES